MVFKLVRIDTQEPSKIKLSIGNHVIGRGKFLHNDDTDKRVSRNHAELEVTSDTVILKSLHQNPCFYIRKSTTETELLNLNNTISLCHGDKFGLLPDHFWYEVLHCMDTGDNVNGGEQSIEQNNGATETNAENEEPVIFQKNDEAKEPLSTASQSLLPAEPEQEQAQAITNQPEVKQEVLEDNVPPDNDIRSPAKRNHSLRESSPVDAKKVKTEPVDASDAAGPSNGQQASTDNNGIDNAAAPAPPAKPQLRERCIYGANCYRRNPQHKAQFSHPADADWGGGARGVCPYGAACRRREPRHWDSHAHPPGTAPPHLGPRPGQRRKRRQRDVSDSDDDNEEDSVSGLIVTGKRARKTVHRQDWSDVESEEEEKDPYGTDESDEWQPHSHELASSQDFSQDYS